MACHVVKFTITISREAIREDIHKGKIGETDSCIKDVSNEFEVEILKKYSFEKMIRLQTCTQKYTMLEYFPYTLATFVAREKQQPSILWIKLIRDILECLSDMHRFDIVHGYLGLSHVAVQELQLVLNPVGYVAKLFDFSNSRKLNEGEYEPKSMDVFYVGGIIGQCLIGRDPFGEDRNLLEKNALCESFEQRNLSRCSFEETYYLLRSISEAGITSKEALSHPLFWGVSKKTRFLHDALRFAQPKGNTFLGEIRGWKDEISDRVWDRLKNKRDSFDDNVVSVLRFISNNSEGWQDHCINTFMRAVLRKFPELLMHVYEILKREANFRANCSWYFENYCSSY